MRDWNHHQRYSLIFLAIFLAIFSIFAHGCGSGSNRKKKAEDNKPPAAITNLSTLGATTSSIALSWSAPGDDGNTGTAATYDIRYSNVPVNDTNWVNAVTINGIPLPQSAGTKQDFTVTGLTCGTIYNFAIRTSDEVPNTSAVSNNVSGTTSICPDSTAPSNTTGSDFINSGAIYTTSASVNLAISSEDADGVTAYYASEDSTTPEASSAGWIAVNKTTSYKDSVLFTLSSNNDIKYVYIWFIDVQGNVSASMSDSIIADYTPPPAPAGLTVKVVNADRIDLSWTESTDNSGIYVYNIYRNGNLIGTSTTTTFSDTDLLTGSAYSYTVSVVDMAGNESETSIPVSGVANLSVAITSPKNLITVASSPINVSGVVNDPAATVTVNGVSATADGGGQFEVQGIVISEGMNTIVARALDSDNNVATASVNISLDSTPPHIAITSPVNGYKTASSPITVTGIINDIVRGTVNENQGRVLVNGIEAGISNRNFIVESVPLNPGANSITAVGADQWGNTASTSVTINFDTTPRAMISVVSGNNQSGAIGSTLNDPFVVSVVDETGAPVAGATTIFRVTENNGTLTGPTSGRAVPVVTGADGLAHAALTLGTWAGSGNNKVEVTSTGVDGSAIFTASGLQKPPAAIYVAQGGQQRGAVSQLLPEPLVAYVTDEGHNPLKNVSVIFKAVEGGGLFTNGLDTITISSDSDGRAAMSFILGPKAGNDSNIVEATFGGNTSSPATFMATALIAGDPGNTKISGVVLDNSNNPINNVTMRVEGTTREAKTDTNGQFIITNVPVGPVHLIADGSTAGTPGVLEYPNLMYELTTISGADNTVGMPIYLVPIDLTNAKLVGGNEDVTYTIPDVPGFSFTVKANSVTFPDGRKQGYISVTQVHADKVPMVPQIGQQPNFIVTIQPPGTVFDPPAPITIPNIDGLSPGEKTSMYSFDHDLGVFVSIGTGTVSEDGILIKSDAGTGVVKAGWHSGGNPNPQGFICNCGECRTCSNNACVPLNGIACTDDGDVCTQDICNAGACIHTPAANGTACADDGDSCTENVCQGGLCSHPLAPNGTLCTDDGDSCTDNVCMGGTCTHPVLPDGASCADEGNKCTDNFCLGGVCTHPAMPDGILCDDEGNSCTEDKCSGGVCSHPSLPDGTHCPGDGNFCSEDKCNSGVCVHNQLPDGTTCINDNDLCTLDVCKSGSCNHEQQGTGSDQCCNPNTGNVVPKNAIINLDECPNRVERPGFVKSFNGCGPAVCPGCIPDNPNAANLVCLALGQAPSFTQACNIHDLCYDTCGATQMECDLEFLTNMLGFCSFLTDEGCRNICIANANIYAASVGGAGGPIAYIPAQKNACLCCP